MRSILSMIAAIAMVVFAGLGASPAKAAPGGEPPCGVMIDVSGSMQGYADAPGAPMVGVLDQLRQMCPRALVFGDGLPRSLPQGQKLVFSDVHTNIGPALTAWSNGVEDGAFLILVTDNVADSGHKGADPTREFYDFLRKPDSPISHIVVLSFRAPFKGLLFDPRDDDRPGVPYSGPRALTIYMLAKNALGREAAFADLRQRLTQVLSKTGRSAGAGAGDYDSYAVFDIKPFAQETFRVESRAAGIQSQTTGGKSDCAADARFNAADKTFELVNQPMSQSCALKANLMVRFPDRWCLMDTDLKATLDLSVNDPSVMKQSVRALNVNPSKANLCQADQKLEVGMAFDAFAFKENVTFLDKLQRTFTGSFSADGMLTVVGAVRRDNVNLGQRVASAWSFGAEDVGGVITPDVRLQRRVFRLDEVVRSTIPDAQLERHELARYPVKVKVKYSQAPLFIALFLVLLAVAVLIVLALLVGRPRRYLIESDDGGEARLQLGMFGSGGAVSGSGRISIRLLNLGLILLGSSNGRIVRGGVLGAAGGRIEAAMGGTAPARRKRPPRRKASDGDFGDFDDFEDDIGGGAPEGESVTFTVRDISQRASKREELGDESF